MRRFPFCEDLLFSPPLLLRRLLFPPFFVSAWGGLSLLAALVFLEVAIFFSYSFSFSLVFSTGGILTCAGMPIDAVFFLVLGISLMGDLNLANTPWYVCMCLRKLFIWVYFVGQVQVSGSSVLERLFFIFCFYSSGMFLGFSICILSGRGSFLEGYVFCAYN